jgi:hypothetical protein
MGMTEVEELYLALFLALGSLATAWQAFRWARKTRTARRRTLAFERSIQETVDQLRLRTGVRL